MSHGSNDVKRLRDLHAEATRAALVQSAVVRFARDGYGGTSLDDIASDVGTTKGAVYHHFKDKQRVFQAAYEHLSHSLIGALEADPRTSEGGVRGAINAFLALASQDSYRRVLFIEGPAVLGNKLCREIDMRYALGLLSRLVGQYSPQALLDEVSIGVLASMLIALLIEAAQLISAAEDPEDTLRQVDVVLKTSIGALTGAL